MTSQFALPALSVPFRRNPPACEKRENELVARCLAGDDDAWEILVRRNSGLVYGLCYRFTGDSFAAEDLTQEVFLRVFRALGTFRCGDASLATWLSRLTRNLLVDHYRASHDDRLLSAFDDNPGLQLVVTHHSANPERALAQREARDLVQSILAKLEPELREPVIFRDLEDMNYRDIALAAGIPVGTVKSRLNRARAELARIARRLRPAA